MTAATILFACAAAGSEIGTNWSLAITDIDYQNVALLTQDSENTVPDEYATQDVHPQIRFRCLPGTSEPTSVSVDWRRFISSFNTEIGFKVDDKELLLQNWGVDRSNKITAPRSDDDNQALLAYLHHGNTLQIEIIPYAESLITVTYDISGIDAALSALTLKCSD